MSHHIGSKKMFIIIGASSFIGVYTATHFIEQGEKKTATL